MKCCMVPILLINWDPKFAIGCTRQCKKKIQTANYLSMILMLLQMDYIHRLGNDDIS